MDLIAGLLSGLLAVGHWRVVCTSLRCASFSCSRFRVQPRRVGLLLVPVQRSVELEACWELVSLRLLAARGSYVCCGVEEASLHGSMRDCSSTVFLQWGSLRDLVLDSLSIVQARLSLRWASMDLLDLVSVGVRVGWSSQDVVVLGTPLFLVRPGAWGCDERCIFPE